MYIDTHCHLHDDKLSDSDAVVKGYLDNGVSVVINMACCALTANKGKNLAEKYPSIYFGTGCHPCDAFGFDEKEFENAFTVSGDAAALRRVELRTAHGFCRWSCKRNDFR